MTLSFRKIRSTFYIEYIESLRLESFTEIRIGEVFPLKSKKRSQIKDFNYFFNSNEGAPKISDRLGK